MAILASIGAVSGQLGTPLTFNYFEGEKKTLVFKGTNAAIKTLYDGYKVVAGSNPDYDNISFEPSRGGATLTLTVIGDGKEVYEMMVNELSSPIESHPEFETLTDDQIVAVKRYVDENLSKDAAWTDLQKNLYSHMMHGMTEYPVSQYVLRETKNISKRSTLKAEYANVNLKDTPPDTATVNTLLGSIPTQEWLKKSPVVRQVGNRRWQIITEWWGAAKLSKLLYGGTLEYT